VIALLGLALALVTAPADAKIGLVPTKADSGRAVATKAKVDVPDTSRAVATKAVASKAAGIDTGVVATRAVRDTAEVHHLPPRTLPLKRQMMFAGGFMVFIALMMTSLQNFNPND
jgi:hypothetical protein